MVKHLTPQKIVNFVQLLERNLKISKCRDLLINLTHFLQFLRWRNRLTKDEVCWNQKPTTTFSYRHFFLFFFFRKLRLTSQCLAKFSSQQFFHCVFSLYSANLQIRCREIGSKYHHNMHQRLNRRSLEERGKFLRLIHK